MSVPKKRQASGRTKRRRSHHKLSTIPHKITADGTIVRRHHATPEDLVKSSTAAKTKIKTNTKRKTTKKAK